VWLLHISLLTPGRRSSTNLEEIVAADTAGRPAQRRRTRRAIVDATSRLLAAGETPTIADIAAAAEVSRRTVYMHFPSLEHLLVDATLGMLSQDDVDAVLAADDLADDPAARVEAIARSLQRMSPDVERLGRQLIRLTVEPPAAASGDARGGGTAPRRGYRRITWIETALAPLRDQLDEAAFRRLVNGIAMVIGWEPLIVQRDICGLDAEQGEELSVWAARALLDATLRDAGLDVGRKGARRPSPPSAPMG
jgi:AcrR family transcriptional regulator